MIAITDLTFVSAIGINVSHDRTPKQKDVAQKKRKRNKNDNMLYVSTKIIKLFYMPTKFW